MPKKFSNYIKVSDELYPYQSAKLIKELMDERPKNIWLFKKRIEVGTVNDDFINNLKTIVFTALFYKKPGFIYTRSRVQNRKYER